MTAAEVISGPRRCSVAQADCLDWLTRLPDDSVDLLFTSPPYEAARTYGIDFRLRGQTWVDWMVAVIRAAAPKVKGLIAIVCEGRTENFAYSGTPFLLAADLLRAGFNLRKPCVYYRYGIMGDGGDWLRTCGSRSSVSPDPAGYPGTTTRQWASLASASRAGILPIDGETVPGSTGTPREGDETATRRRRRSMFRLRSRTPATSSAATSAVGSWVIRSPTRTKLPSRSSCLCSLSVRFASRTALSRIASPARGRRHKRRSRRAGGLSAVTCGKRKWTWRLDARAG
jgi:hypothetical protein